MESASEGQRVPVGQGNIGIVVFMPLKPKFRIAGGFPILKPLEQRVRVPDVVLARTLDRRETQADQGLRERFGR